MIYDHYVMINKKVFHKHTSAMMVTDTEVPQIVVLLRNHNEKLT